MSLGIIAALHQRAKVAFATSMKARSFGASDALNKGGFIPGDDAKRAAREGCTEIPPDFGSFEISKFNGFCNFTSCIKKRLVFVQAVIIYVSVRHGIIL